MLCFLMPAAAADAGILKPVKLWKTHVNTGMYFLETIEEEKTVYSSYSRTPLPMQLLSDLLWAAYGCAYNKAKDADADAVEFQKIDIYVSMEQGCYIYDPVEHQLLPVIDEDIRWMTGQGDYVKNSPVNLIYVNQPEGIVSRDVVATLMLPGVRSGMIAQKVSLFCASFHLYTSVRININRDKLAEILNIDDINRIILCQSVGLPVYTGNLSVKDYNDS